MEDSIGKVNTVMASVSDEKLAGELNAEWIAREMLDNGVE